LGELIPEVALIRWSGGNTEWRDKRGIRNEVHHLTRDGIIAHMGDLRGRLRLESG